MCSSTTLGWNVSPSPMNSCHHIEKKEKKRLLWSDKPCKPEATKYARFQVWLQPDLSARFKMAKRQSNSGQLEALTASTCVCVCVFNLYFFQGSKSECIYILSHSYSCINRKSADTDDFRAMSVIVISVQPLTWKSVWTWKQKRVKK